MSLGPFFSFAFCFLETGLAGECAGSALVGVAGLLLFTGCFPSEASSGISLFSLVCEAGSRIVAGISRALASFVGACSQRLNPFIFCSVYCGRPRAHLAIVTVVSSKAHIRRLVDMCPFGGLAANVQRPLAVWDAITYWTLVHLPCSNNVLSVPGCHDWGIPAADHL